MNTILGRVVAVAAGLVLAIGVPGRAIASLILDQQNVIDTSGGFTEFLLGANNIQVAETFTVGIAGTLSRIEVQAHREGGTAPLIADLYPTIAGVPDPSVSLANWSLASASVPTPSSTLIPLDLGASAFPVLPGQVFAIALSAPGGIFANDYGWPLGINTYAGGAGYTRTLPAGSFTLFSTFAADPGFRTFVDVPTSGVPEPGTLLLLGSGLAGLAGLAWRRGARK